MNLDSATSPPGGESRETGALFGGCDGCVSRRAFLTQSALAAATAAFLAACGDGQIGGGITNPSGSVQIAVASFPGLATVGTIVMVDDVRAAKRTGATTFVSYSRVCTHAGELVSLDGNAFLCVNGHGSRFDNNGQVTLGPASRNLTQLVTSYDPATDILTIG